MRTKALMDSLPKSDSSSFAIHLELIKLEDENLLLKLDEHTRQQYKCGQPNIDKLASKLCIIFGHCTPNLHYPSVYTVPISQQDDTLTSIYKPFQMITTAPKNGRWVCIKRLPACRNESCSTINAASFLKCWSCHGDRPTLRPIFAYLQRVAGAAKKEIQELTRQIYLLDEELWKNEEALKLTIQHTVNMKVKPTLVFSANNKDGIPKEHLSTEIDLNLVQNGVIQRIEANAAVPHIKENIATLSNRLFQARCKLTLLFHFIYEKAVPHLQRFLRGHFTRNNIDTFIELKRNWDAQKAAGRLQNVIRRRLARKKFQRLQHTFSEHMATKIQTLLRHCVAVNVREKLIADLHHVMASKIQIAFRQYFLVRQAKVILYERAYAREQERLKSLEKQRNLHAETKMIVIQCWLRRKLAEEAARRRLIELDLHGRLLKLLDDFKTHGKLHRLLWFINEDYHRYERVIDEIVRRENTMASTFVSKVIALREQENREAWYEYNNLETDGKRGYRKCQGQPKGTYEIRNRHQGGKINSSIKSRKKKNLGMYESNACENPNKFGERAKSIPDENLTAKAPTLREADLLMIKDGKSYFKCLPKCLFSGLSIARDIPNGIHDTALRLLRSASIRCYKPTFVPPGADPFQYYLLLPDGLEKAQFEKEAWARVEPVARELKEKFNVVFVHQLMPTAKMIELFQGLYSIPSQQLLNKCSEILLGLDANHQDDKLTRAVTSGSEIKSACRDFMEKRLSLNMNPKNPMCPLIYHLNSKIADKEDENHLCGSLWHDRSTSDDVSSNVICSIRRRSDEKSNISNLRHRNKKSSGWVLAYSNKVKGDAEERFRGYRNFKMKPLETSLL